MTYVARAYIGGNENVDFDSWSYTGGQLAGVAAAYIIGAQGAELKVSKNLRLALYGNRPGHPTGRFPRYHRRQFDASGRVPDGGSLNWHRPWDPVRWPLRRRPPDTLGRPAGYWGIASLGTFGCAHSHEESGERHAYRYGAAAIEQFGLAVQ